MSEKANYGIDAPGIVLGFAAVGAVGLALALFFSRWWLALSAWGLWSAISMLRGSLHGKFTVRDRMLDGLSLDGGARILDVGCGRGLLLLGAAKRLTAGKAVGVDIWQTKDQSGNNPATTRRNAALEGVSDKIELVTADARKLPFEGASFDAVISSLAIHNVPDAAGRADSIREIARVLKPGGKLSIYDILGCTDEYAKSLAELGFADIRQSERLNVFYKDALLTAVKAAQVEFRS
jgi:ubiquinone/menaquinone biosynthesis C-methylase UbiE